MKKLRPILFSTPMVQAILEGRKTQTRRVVKIAPPNFDNDNALAWEQDGYVDKCPYGKVGDVLWVRESYLWVMRDHAHDLLEGAKDNNQWVYKASVHDDFITYAKEQYRYKWRPSIHMPFSAARIFLEITNVRVERLQSITENDAIAEGIKNSSTGFFKDYLASKDDPWPWTFPHRSFMSLWQSINGLDSWNANPWVWVVEFKRITKEEATK